MNKQEQKAVEEAAKKIAGCENGFNCGRCPEHERQYECGRYLQKESFVEGADFLSDLRKQGEPETNVGEVGKEADDGALSSVSIPSSSEYREAKKIVTAYEDEQDRLEKIRLKEFEAELSVFFKTNAKLIIRDFDLREQWGRYEIIPVNPCLDGSYNGQLDDGIKNICQKHNIKASIVYWCYHK